MGRGGVDENVVMCGAVCCGLVYMASIIMIGCSFDTLGPLQAGIEFNTFSQSINKEQVFTSGRYFLGLGKAFLEFPRDYQNIDFGSSADADEPALVMEQSQVTIECSMQYTLKLDKLTDIYAAYELRYHDKMVKEATNAIKNSVSDYLPAKFYQERRQVAQEMQEAVATALDGQNAVLQDFQLRRVTLRPQNDDDVIRKIVTAESQRTALNVQKQKEIDAQKTVIAGKEDRLISIFQAEKQRNATIIREGANAQAKKLRLESQTRAYAVMRQTVGMTQDQLLKYLWIQRLRSLPESTKLLVGFDDAVITT